LKIKEHHDPRSRHTVYKAWPRPAFEQAFAKAQLIISSMQGYVSHQLQRCLEAEDKYLLLVNWQRLEDHTVGFRQSPQYEEWRQLLHHFYEPFPVVEHFEIMHDSCSGNL
jgi:heme-degrading monooxygenase HmoA